MPRPETLAVRAVNQYRRREVLAYVGLRYYFDNICSVRDRWAENVASHLVRTRLASPYYKIHHFKDYSAQENAIAHRDMHIPGPNEAFCEAFLLDQCRRAGIGHLPSHVYSYRLVDPETKTGIYEPYFTGYRQRHNAVLAACRRSSTNFVLYTDIRRFYPSISHELALRAWRNACERGPTAFPFRELGERILADHAAVRASNSAGLLTGPMFSHLIANLVLKDIDREMAQLLPDGYFRYVDDIIIVGSRDEVSNGRTALREKLAALGLRLHDTDKHFEVSVSEWLDGANDFNDDGNRPSWPSVVGGIKNLLTARPLERDNLIRELKAEEFRFPLPDYSGAIREQSRLERFTELASMRWFKQRMRRLSVGELVSHALRLRQKHREEFRNVAEGASSLVGFQRKRRITKLRYHAARLAYLAPPDELEGIADIIEPIQEVRFYAEVLRAIGTQDVSRLLSFGTNTVQAAAQPLRVLDRPLKCSLRTWGEPQLQGLAILRLNGLDIPDVAQAPEDDLTRFAKWSDGSTSLMKSEDPFIRELACLHGHRPDGRHRSILDVAFDQDEDLALDAINLVNVTS